jgi:hypothetical protein
MISSYVYQLQSMILSGYIAISSSMINLEIVIAGARSGIPLRDIFFEISNPNIGDKEKLQLLRWQVFLSRALHIPMSDPGDMHSDGRMTKVLVRQSDGSYRVNIHSVCVAIVHATCQCSRTAGQKIVLLLAVVNTAIAGYMAERPVGRQDVAYVVCVLAMNLIYYTVMLNILYAAVQEMHRKSCFSDILESMIRLHDYNLKANVRFGGGGKSTDDRMITSEIKTIQDLIFENTDMIRLSSCSCDEGGGGEEGRGVALRASLLAPGVARGSTGGQGQRQSQGGRRESRGAGMFSDIAESLAEGGAELTETDTDGPSSSSSSSSSQGGASEEPSFLSFYFPNDSSISSADSSVEMPGSTMADFHFPQIELLQYSDNFTTWMQCRKILHNFGYRFSFRLNALIGD